MNTYKNTRYKYFYICINTILEQYNNLYTCIDKYNFNFSKNGNRYKAEIFNIH